jgi:hypothetical protein
MQEGAFWTLFYSFPFRVMLSHHAVTIFCPEMLSCVSNAKGNAYDTIFVI